jgi:hypothetical protein
MSPRTLARLFALFLLGLVLFLPPVVSLPRDGSVLGVPCLFVYLFGAWAALIALLVFVVERRVIDRNSVE